MPRPYLRLCGLIVGVGAAGVVGRIDHMLNLRDLLPDQDLDSLPQGDVDHAAALAATAEENVGGIALNVHQLDVAAVLGHGRVDLLVEQLLDGLSGRLIPDRIRIVDLEAALGTVGLPVDRGPTDTAERIRIDEHPEITGV